MMQKSLRLAVMGTAGLSALASAAATFAPANTTTRRFDQDQAGIKVSGIDNSDSTTAVTGGEQQLQQGIDTGSNQPDAITTDDDKAGGDTVLAQLQATGRPRTVKKLGEEDSISSLPPLLTTKINR